MIARTLAEASSPPNRQTASSGDLVSAREAPRICALPSLDALDDQRLGQIIRLHFDWVDLGVPHSSAAALGPKIDRLKQASTRAKRAGLQVMVDLDLDPGDSSATSSDLVGALASIVQGIRCLGAHRSGADPWRRLIDRARGEAPDLIWVADTLGAPADETARLLESGFDFFLSSIRWWNTRDAWALEQYERFRGLARSIGFPETFDDEGLRIELARSGITDPAELASFHRLRYALAAFFGAGIMMPAGFEFCATRRQGAGAPAIDLQAAITAINRLKATHPILSQETVRRLVPWNEGMLWVGIDPRGRPTSCFLCNPTRRGIAINPGEAAARAGLDIAHLQDVSPVPPPRLIDRPLWLGPADWRIFAASRELRERPAPRRARAAAAPLSRAARAGRGDRIVIETVWPELDGGRYPAKRIVGDRLEVWADIFSDGHHVWNAALLVRPNGAATWSLVPMRLYENDRWVGAAPLTENNRHRYTIEAWTDLYASWRNAVASKYDAGQDVALELAEGRRLIAEAAKTARGEARRRLEAALAATGNGCRTAAQIDHLLASDVQSCMAEWGPRRDVTRYRELDLVVDRPLARFGAWYEMFPRSQGDQPGKSATFRDCIKRLDDISGMGFDVVYLVPIHPTGETNRKGRNNAVSAGPGDPGSPYAIGSAAGGHDAVDPALGTLEDFRAFVAACRERNMEVALDFAVQCSLDHPWVKEHPDWFEFRPDGSIKFAENPPKKYQDIVNLNLAGDGPAALWQALCDVVLFWIAQGVRIFRVDNPHTKPFPFWEWLIGEVQARHPETIFLSEAFTRPKPMRLLAKLGFTQSYTYFTWRNSKQELVDYLTELTRSEAREYLRPNFFTNTPDILPGFLQTGGPPAFKIRVALAATLSGSYGIYNGFELCEARAVAGTEEYLDSEKYQFKVWDWDRPGNIKSYIAALNRSRSSHTVLQNWLELEFLSCDNDRVICFAKIGSLREKCVFVAINLDPYHVQRTMIELPLEKLHIAEYQDFAAENLLNGEIFRWVGRHQQITLEPEQPALIVGLTPAGFRAK